MHRFTTNETKKYDQKSKGFLSLLIAPVLLIAFWFILSSVDESTINRQKESLESALNRDILHCYAVEGYYPPSLDYIKEHYGLSYNEDLFVIDYRPIGGNIRPDVTVLTVK